MIKMIRKKNGSLSIPFVILCMVALVLFMTIFEELKSNTVIRNLESVADLAAVESIRLAVDEKSLANERLTLDMNDDHIESAEDMGLIRDAFITKVKSCMSRNSNLIVRVEIPEVDATGNIIIPADYENGEYTNSLPSTAFTGPYGDERQYAYCLGGNDPDNSAMSVVCDRTNLASSGTKIKTSYMLESKVLVIYRANSLLNRFGVNTINYTNIFGSSENVKILNTRRIAPNVNAITLQVVGKVTLR